MDARQGAGGAAADEGLRLQRVRRAQYYAAGFALLLLPGSFVLLPLLWLVARLRSARLAAASKRPPVAPGSLAQP